MFHLLFNLVRILKILSRQQILTHSEGIKLPKMVKILGQLSVFIFYPLGIVRKPKEAFGKRLTNCCEQLGPIYIKFGQSLSTRPDLVGIKVTQYLQTLQDRLPPFDSNIAKHLIFQNFEQNTQQLFLHFDEIPIAAASISQVHKAQLITGEMVAVKILRPGIHYKYNKDIKLLYFLAKMASKTLVKFKRLRPLAVVKVFHETMKFELDLRLEAAAASELRDNFSKDPSVYIPKIYWQLTSENILTTEWVSGVSIYNTQELLALGLNLSLIAQKFAVMFFNQAYRDGFFHADLHPGNILVNIDGTIILLDFGIMGRISDSDRLSIAESLFGFLRKNYMLVARVHLRAGYIPKNTNLELFAQSCRAVAEPITGVLTKNISIGKLLAQLFKITEDFGMEVQPQLLLLQKTIVMVEGVGQQLDPEINMWQLAEPWIKKWAAKNLSPEAKILRIAQHFITELLEKVK